MDENVYSGTQEQINTMLILMQEGLPVVRDLNLIEPFLPQSNAIKRIPNHPCYSLKSEEFVKVTDVADNGTITRREEIYSKYPQGKQPSYLLRS